MKTTGYTTRYAVYYIFGSVYSGGLSAPTVSVEVNQDESDVEALRHCITAMRLKEIKYAP